MNSPRPTQARPARSLLSATLSAAALAATIALHPITTRTAPLTDPSGLRAWITSADPLDVAAELTRLATIGILVYLLVISLLLLAVSSSSSPRPRQLITNIAPAFLVLLLTSGTMLAPNASAQNRPGPNAPSGDSPPTMEVVSTAGSPKTFLPWGPGEEPTSSTSAPVLGPKDRQAVTVNKQMSSPVPEPALATHVVQVGEHFWSIAEDTLESRRGSEADQRDVVSYWRRLIEANRDRLVDPDNPDFILPGQTFVLPR